MEFLKDFLRERKLKKIAKSMLNRNFSIDIISERTGLSKKEIEALN